jgi:neural Wiskott-Aldrich syndrome protein
MPQSFAEQLKSFPLSPNLGQSLERAHRFAREQSHRLVTLEHLLLALTEDPEAVIIMQSANVDVGRLTTDVSDHLGRLMDDMRANGAAEPRPDAELLRVLQAAASAAQQSRRRQIDGAIVLAAIVGDGKSPAAGMLKSLGMTFEEAIRALQRANTKARLKPQTKPSAAAASTAQPAAAPTATAAAVKPDATPAEEAKKAEPAPAAPVSAAQTAEDILAAARERIRQRSAAAKAERAASAAQPADAAPAATPEVDAEPTAGPVDSAETETLAGAIEAAMTAPPVRAPAPTPSPPARAAAESPPAPYPSQPGWTPPGERRPAPAPRSQVSRLPRPIQPGEGPPRPPLPSRAQAGFFPNRAPRAPWPEPSEPLHGPRGPLANGSPAGAQRSAREGYAPTPQRPTPSQRAGGLADRGPLVENVPRLMRVGVPVTAEVRIARDRIDSLIMALNGRGVPYRSDAFATRALTVRLRAPNGGFWIEPASPETQWADGSAAHLHDDYAVWRWTVMPHRRGRGRLLLMVSARTVGHDGVAAESAPPDRAIEVKVRANHLRRAGYGAVWIAAFLIGAALGHFGREIWDAGSAFVSRLIGG